jgi:hypothetical protein
MSSDTEYYDIDSDIEIIPPEIQRIEAIRKPREKPDRKTHINKKTRIIEIQDIDDRHH